MAKVVDRRVRKTKKQLKEGLAQLMKEKSIHDITVRELSDLIDINRGTFYLHYRDIYDMLEQIENEIFDDFKKIVDSHKSDRIKKEPLPLVIDIYEYLAVNHEMALALLGKNGDAIFINRIKDFIREECFLEWAKTLQYKDNATFELYYAFMISGCLGLLENWLQNNMKQSSKEIASIVKTLIINGAMILK